ncbi:MAG: hypothetical protein WBW72_02370 [Erwinia billingiae]
MKSKPKNVIVLIQFESGELVQRPLKREEVNFVLPILQEFDGGTLKVIPAPAGLVLESNHD